MLRGLASNEIGPCSREIFLKLPGFLFNRRTILCGSLGGPLEGANVPPILAARIFPPPGQQKGPSPSRFDFFHIFVSRTGQGEKRKTSCDLRLTPYGSCGVSPAPSASCGPGWLGRFGGSGERLLSGSAWRWWCLSFPERPFPAGRGHREPCSPWDIS